MIIANSTVLITLINIDEFEILKLFIEKIIITNEVYSEISIQQSTKSFIDKEITKGYISVKSYENRQLFKEIHFILDSGESSSIALALEENSPLIIDEKKGRKFAKAKGVEVIGLVGILRFLYMEKILSYKRVKEIIDKLNSSDFRISQKLLDIILN